MGLISDAMVREGTWWIKSDIDPRWNAAGSGRVGGMKKPKEIDEKIEELKQSLGEPPEDLEWGYTKR